jgi:hypothetical protein
MFRLLAEPKVYELIKNEILWRMDIHLAERRTVVHLFPPLKCTFSELIPFPYRIQVGLESTVHVHPVDWSICPVFQECYPG